MFKSLELNGFKSFADRTRFEFPTGITAVVGPNGSGKSNIVDAIKWVLGSQSPKALRGKEMTDVIFSGARSRGQTNSAEVTLAFDNSSGVLDVDAEEVQITRRVYRSGEGEYLINRQPCRLRDIRDVFAGTGVSTGAYSIIEQGKVDALLQSSPRERRLIFEEAAGVSRFKIKRQEAARRLERVDQNLLRLSDIVDELDSRLRSVRSQAGRARKYKEHSDRLRQLRTQCGVADWRSLSAKLGELQRQAAKLREATEQLHSQVAGADAQLADADANADRAQKELDNRREEAASIREQIAQSESTRGSQIARSDELQQESVRLQKQLAAMTSRAGDAQQLVAETSSALEEAERHFEQFDNRLQSQQTQLDQARQGLAECRGALEQSRGEHDGTFRTVAQLENQIPVVESQGKSAATDSERFSSLLQEVDAKCAELAQKFADADRGSRQLESDAKQSQGQLTSAQEKLRKDRQQLSQTQSQLADLRGRLIGARERAVVLEELERRLDGLSAGTKEVLRLAREQPNGPFGGVRGVVADLLHVDADTAGIVEIALGERANHLLIDRLDPAMLAMDESQWAGRTSFLRLDVPQPASAVDRIDLSSEPGVMGRADQFVETAPDLATLARRLLGRYWFVDTIETAVRLAHGTGRGLNYVTVVGEVVTADGSLVVGPCTSSTGLLSRRSELRALVDEIGELQQQVERLDADCTRLEQGVEEDEQRQHALAVQHEKTAGQLNNARLQAASTSERLRQASAQRNAVAAELQTAQQQATDADAELVTLRNELAANLDRLADLEQRREQQSEQGAQLEQQVAMLQQTVTDHRVALARGEQRRDGLRRQMQQLDHDRQEHDRALDETQDRQIECHQQREQLGQSVLELSSELTELYRAKEDATQLLEQLAEQQDQSRGQRSQLVRALDALRKQLLDHQGRQQQAELHVEQFEHQRRELTTRLADDYDIDLAEVVAMSPEMEVGDRQAVDEEILALRQQLQNVGPVNLEALSELEAVEDRHQALSRQYEDLRTAKEQLEQLVTKINVESRELFVASLDVIRGHFQELYSNLFGGGEADIVMESRVASCESREDGTASPSDNSSQLTTHNSQLADDVLECGIEIVARPPGKQLRSISLLSGGERTLTCVALLLAIFRSRPSPFCVLDEVDAALDEANIDRFVEVLKQFMASTQFIVVTHSKRTMACADTLYGITMQESGVSKRVSVRFEDVSADGEIRTAA